MYTEAPSIHIANANRKTQPSLCHPDRSGGIFSFTLGRNESRECSELFALHHWLEGKGNDLRLQYGWEDFRSANEKRLSAFVSD
jgi:hypothetical protein